MKKALLLIVATLVLWWLSHLLLESVWALTHVTEATPAPRIVNLLLIPVALGVAWWLLPDRRAEGEGRPRS
jgi:hypothetical protein